MQQTSSSQSEEQENTVTHVSVTVTSGDNVEEPNIPSIRIVDDQQRGSTEATESGATPSEGISLNLIKLESLVT